MVHHQKTHYGTMMPMQSIILLVSTASLTLSRLRVISQLLWVSGVLQDTAKLLHLNKGQVVTAYSAFQRLTQRAGLPGQPVGDPPSLLPPIPADAQQALAMVGLKEAGVPSLADIGYHDQPTSPFKVHFTPLQTLYKQKQKLCMIYGELMGNASFTPRSYHACPRSSKSPATLHAIHKLTLVD